MSVVPGGGGVSSTAPAQPRLATFFVVDCVLATVVRLLLAVTTSGYGPDIETFQSWATTLRDRPLDQFYAVAYKPDHLPGDLWILKLVTWLYGVLGGTDLEGRGFALVLQLVPMAGDLVVAGMLLLLVRDLRDSVSAGRVARWYLLNPATIFVTGIWGQWDSVSLAILLTGVWLTTRRGLWVLSPGLLAWGVLVKPQLGLPCVCVALVLAYRLVEDGLGMRALAARAAGFVAVASATAYAVLRPFGVGLLRAPHGGWSLAERLHAALDVWPYTTVGAANVWMLRIRSLDRRRDDGAGWLGLSPDTWGTVLLLVAVVVVASIALVRLRPAGAVAAGWVGTSTAFAAFLFPTRVHERYLFPALAIGLLLAAFSGWERRLVAWFWASTAAFTANLALVLFGGLHGPGGHTIDFGSGCWLVLTLVMIGLFVSLLGWPFVSVAADSPRPRALSRLRRLPRRGTPVRESVIDWAGH